MDSFILVGNVKKLSGRKAPRAFAGKRSTKPAQRRAKARAPEARSRGGVRKIAELKHGADRPAGRRPGQADRRRRERRGGTGLAASGSKRRKLSKLRDSRKNIPKSRRAPREQPLRCEKRWERGMQKGTRIKGSVGRECLKDVRANIAGVDLGCRKGSPGAAARQEKARIGKNSRSLARRWSILRCDSRGKQQDNPQAAGRRPGAGGSPLRRPGPQARRLDGAFCRR